MSVIGFIALLLTLGSYRVACGGSSRASAWLWAACVLAHVAVAIAYWQYSLAEKADSWLYYSDFLGWAGRDWAPGTVFVIKVVQLLKDWFEGSYFEYFLFFQSFGMFGIALLIRIFDEIAQDLGARLATPALALLFLPGLHFWTSAIGKDAPLFLGIILTMWAAMRIQTRVPAFLLALLIITPIRPHISAIAGIALLGTLLFEARVRFAYKLLMGLMLLPAMALVFQAMQDSLDIASLNPDGITEFLASNRELGLRQGAGPLELPFFLRILTLLFRPFFFDATGLLGWVASLENLILVLLFVVLARHMATVIRLAASVAYVRYCLLFSFVLILLLAAVSFNVGLGLRQKWMAMPAILLLFMTLITYRRATAASQLANPSTRATPAEISSAGCDEARA